MNGTTLVNKANSWKSNDIWALNSIKGREVYLENTSKGKVLVTVGEEVKLMENSPGQKLEMGEANKEGYFTLTHPSSEKALTASSNESFELKGRMSC